MNINEQQQRIRKVARQALIDLAVLRVLEEILKEESGLCVGEVAREKINIEETLES